MGKQVSTDSSESPRPSEQDIVIGTNPPPGVRVPKGSPVELLLCPRELIKNTMPPKLTQQSADRRMRYWLHASISPNIRKLENRNSWFFPVSIQRLGYLDLQLLEQDVKFASMTKEQRKEPGIAQAEFIQHGTAAMWVMSGFQILYTLEKRMQVTGTRFHGLQGKIDDTKKEFLRIRSPLAKGKGFARSDFPYPWHSTRIAGSVCWYIDSKTLITRTGLANKLVGLLLAISDHGREKPLFPIEKIFAWAWKEPIRTLPPDPVGGFRIREAIVGGAVAVQPPDGIPGKSTS